MQTIAKRFFILFLGAILITVAACANNNCNSEGYECSEGSDNQYGEMIGSVLGSVIGGVLGSKVGGGDGKTIATATGAIVGLIVGKEIGKSIDNGDFSKADEAAQDSLENNPDGETTSWSDPDSGDSVSITPQTAYINDDGEDCRDFESTITVDGKTEVAHGRACRQPDGSWKVVN
ncbi:MAG: glycine zipper 2TM domain-containing protein [Rhodospirillales bacterium]|jgi:surface antigen|nr:glycine zipper 2TM domain-containing protein [Rhodospirillales bacterium]